MYDPEVAKLKSNITQQNTASIKELTHILIPKTIMDFHPNVNLSADYVYV